MILLVGCLFCPLNAALSPFPMDDSYYFGDNMRLVYYSSANDYQGPSVEEEAAARAVTEMVMRQAMLCP